MQELLDCQYTLSKEKNSMKRLFIGIGLAGIGFGAYTYVKTQLEIFKNTKFKIIKVKNIGSRLKQINLELTIEVTNDSSISFKITDYYFDILMDNLVIGSAKNRTINQEIKGNGAKSYIPIQVSLNTADIIVGALSGLEDKELNINGYFGIKKGIIKYRNIKVEETIKLNDFL